jgi:hypothetical protein
MRADLRLPAGIAALLEDPRIPAAAQVPEVDERSSNRSAPYV